MFGGHRRKTAVVGKLRGFTLVEVSVVFTIMGIMGAWALSSYMGAKKEIYLNFIANRIQVDIRGLFINAISTKLESSALVDEDGNANVCNAATAKVKVLQVKTGVQEDPYNIIPYCENNDGDLKKGVVDNSDPSDFLGYKQSVDVSAIVTDGGTTLSGPDEPRNIYLIFTSPYGKYYADYDNDEETVSNRILSWIRDDQDRSYSPSANPSDETFTTKKNVQVILKVNNVKHTLDISDNGNVEVD